MVSQFNKHFIRAGLGVFDSLNVFDNELTSVTDHFLGPGWEHFDITMSTILLSLICEYFTFLFLFLFFSIF